MNFGHFIDEGIISPSADLAISIALLAYAAGDAVGAEYEFLTKPYVVQLDRHRVDDSDDSSIWRVFAR